MLADADSLKYSASHEAYDQLMTAERDVLISLLKLTQSGPVSRALFTKATRMPRDVVEKALVEFAQMSLFQEYRGVIEVSPSQRVRLSIHALRVGADIERVCRLLSWVEFEMIAGQAFETNGYRVIKNIHFAHEGKRWELDILGLRKPLLICADCKHWRRGWRNAATVKAVEAQTERTKALAETLPRHLYSFGLEGWRDATLVPLVLSLLPGPHRFHNQVPIVPILQLQDFISGVPGELNLLLHIDKKLEPVSAKINRLL